MSPGLRAWISSSPYEIWIGLSALPGLGHLCLDMQMRMKVSQVSWASLPSASLQLFLFPDLLLIWGPRKWRTAVLVVYQHKEVVS